MNDDKEDKNLKCGESMYGTQLVTIDDVTTGAVIVLTSSISPEFAVLHMDKMDAPRSYSLVRDFVRGYTELLGLEGAVPAQTIEAKVIGGNFREHRNTDRNVLVYVDHVISKEKAEEALTLCGVIFQYVPTDPRATKTVSVISADRVEVSQERRGLNEFDAPRSEADYEMTIGKYDDT